MPTIAATIARIVSSILTAGPTITGAGAGRGDAAAGRGAAAAGAAAPIRGAGACVGAAVPIGGAGAAAAGPPVGPPGGNVGNLIVGAADGLGGKLIRTVSFLGWTFPVSFFGGTAPPGVFGMFSAINVNFGLNYSWLRRVSISLYSQIARSDRLKPSLTSTPVARR